MKLERLFTYESISNRIRENENMSNKYAISFESFFCLYFSSIYEEAKRNHINYNKLHLKDLTYNSG